MTHACNLYSFIMSKAEKNIPNRLRKFRKINSYSQRFVASVLGLRSTSIISRWEKGVSYPNLQNLIKLSLLYRTLIDQLYFDLREDIRVEIDRRKDYLNQPKNNPP